MQLLRHVILILAILQPQFASAQSAATPQRLLLELNAADIVGEACRLTFFVHNEMDTDVEKLVVETVFFSTDGKVELLTLFDFAAIPVGRPRVRQFQVPDTSCDRIGMVLVNGTDACEGGDLSTSLCEKALQVSSRTTIELKG